LDGLIFFYAELPVVGVSLSDPNEKLSDDKSDSKQVTKKSDLWVTWIN
jgi:hypothetical protein